MRTPGHGSYFTYVVGFVMSLLLTLIAYLAVVNHMLSTPVLIATILGLAVIQLAVQLRLFLHLGQEAKPRWNLLAFAFMGLVVAILVLGSLWIMNNLDYHMGSPAETDHYIMEDEGIK